MVSIGVRKGSLSIALTLLVAGCSTVNQSLPSYDSTKKLTALSNLNISNDFNFKTTKDISLNLVSKLSSGEIVGNIKFHVYNKDPEQGGSIITSFQTDSLGKGKSNITIPSYLDSVFITTDYIGLPSKVEFKTDNKEINYTTFENNQSIISNIDTSKASNYFKILADSGFKFMGSFDSSGVPKYLEPKADTVDKTFLSDINASLPESKPVPKFNPSYLEGDKDKNLIITEEADVWITFVHEGAGWLNSLGYYVYDTDNPPQTPADINEKTIVFPNVSYPGSGGNLKTGSKVYLGRFPKGKSIGWFLVAQGWKSGTVQNNVYTVFADQKLNPEPDSKFKQHTVLLNDKTRQKFVIGVEDIRRDWSNCDNDFNDAVFYFTSNPYTAIKQDSLPPVQTPLDSDKDGVTDTFDEYPTDPTKAFTSYYPAKNQVGTLAFEDNWPERGDNDHNDLNLDYNFVNGTTKDGLTSEIVANFTVNAIGAAFKNGFALELPFSHDSVASVEGTNLSKTSYVKLASNGLEQTANGSDKAVAIVFDNAFNLFGSSKDFINTRKSLPYTQPSKISLKIKLKTPIKINDAAPYNPFLIVNGERGREIHLADYNPSVKADMTLFNTKDDKSDSIISRYYKTEKNIPWALHFQEKFNYPKEYIPINFTYYYFTKWAESNGLERKDWYKNTKGYFDPQQLYTSL
jgi:LruC domain-containing protein